MSSDNYILISKNNYAVADYSASGENQCCYFGRFKTLEDAIKEAEKHYSEYGISFTDEPVYEECYFDFDDRYCKNVISVSKEEYGNYEIKIEHTYNIDCPAEDKDIFIFSFDKSALEKLYKAIKKSIKEMTI